MEGLDWQPFYATVALEYALFYWFPQSVMGLMLGCCSVV